MLILSAAEVRQALPMEEVISAMKLAFSASSNGQAEMPLRTALPIRKHEAFSLFMPVYLENESSEALAVKIVSIFPKNFSLGLPLIHAAVILFEPDSGRPIALLEGGALTAIRTGAASGAATDVLARPDAHVAAIFGAGAQARTQLEAVCTVRQIHTAFIYDPNSERVERLIKEMAGCYPVPEDLRAASNPREAVAIADIICTATTSSTPVFASVDLKPGVHINGIGSYTPEMQEVPPETVQRSLVIVDSRNAALSEAGDLIQPLRGGLITAGHIHAELGEIVSGKKGGRTSQDQITFFKSVGIAVQDAAAARLALANCRNLNLGQSIELY
jgi:ornithine cyclodeaminase